MKKVFANHSEVAHVWAQQTQEEGSAGSITFSGDTIYSYGWWEMAKFVTPDVVLMRDWNYSNSTSKHMGHVRNAIPSHVDVIYVDNPASIDESIAQLVNDVKNSYNEFDARRNKDRCFKENRDAFINLKKLCIAMDINMPDIEHYAIVFEPSMVEQVEQYKERKAEIKRVREERKAELERKVDEYRKSPEVDALREKWRDGDSRRTFEYGGNVYPLFNYPALRLKNGEVETFFGARVPEREAKILYKMIAAGKDVKGYQIGYYTVISINGSLKIGCHDIPRKEVEQFAKREWGI